MATLVELFDEIDLIHLYRYGLLPLNTSISLIDIKIILLLLEQYRLAKNPI